MTILRQQSENLKKKMKYKKMKARLEEAIRWFEKLPNKEQAERTKPGSVKWR